jgi:hypothetical protein
MWLFKAHFLFGLELGTINQLSFEGLKKAFSHGVIPAVPFTAHVLCNTVWGVIVPNSQELASMV